MYLGTGPNPRTNVPELYLGTRCYVPVVPWYTGTCRYRPKRELGTAGFPEQMYQGTAGTGNPCTTPKGTVPDCLMSACTCWNGTERYQSAYFPNKCTCTSCTTCTKVQRACSPHAKGEKTSYGCSGDAYRRVQGIARTGLVQVQALRVLLTLRRPR